MSPYWLVALAIGVPVAGIVLKSFLKQKPSSIDGGSVSTSWLSEHRAASSDDRYSHYR